MQSATVIVVRCWAYDDDICSNYESPSSDAAILDGELPDGHGVVRGEGRRRWERELTLLRSGNNESIEK